MPTQTGLDHLVASPEKTPLGDRLGLLANPASVDRRLRHSRDLINESFPGRLRALYAPQHGFFADKQDNMIESADIVDPALKIPIFSLYGDTRIPTADMLEPIDTLIIDLQDVGTRVYTFIYTMSYCLEAARKYGKQVAVLDRPNPINGLDVEGNLLLSDYASFVGRYPIPMRHGLTIGEMARLFNDHFGIGCDLTIIPMVDWSRDMFFADTGLPWIAPSPNLPTPVSALVYPGQVLWEGTTVSEGRGTTRPFELFGAPFIDIAALSRELGPEPISGTVLRPVVFEPTAGKWQGKSCYGFQIHPLEPKQFTPYAVSLKLLQAVLKLYPDDFAWREPPYEYEYEKLPIDLITGDATIRQQLQDGRSVDDMAASWQADLAQFQENIRKYHLYK